MNENQSAKRRVYVLPLAAIQVVASILTAVSAKTGFLHIGVFCIGIAGAMFALQILVSKNYWYFVSAMISVCAAFLISGVIPALLCACAIPAGIVTAILIKKKSTKMTVTVAADIVYIICFAAVFLFAYIYDGYELSVTAVIDHYSAVIEYVKDAVVAGIDEQTMREFMSSMRMNETEFLEFIDALVEELKLILPSIIIASIGIVAYVTACFFKLGTKIVSCELLLPDPRWSLLPSKISAWVFSGAYIAYSVMMMFSKSLGVAFLVCYSIVIIFSPPMLLMGIKWIAAMKSKALVITLFVIGGCFMPPLAIVILAFFGVRETFIRNDAAKRMESDGTEEQ